MTRKKPLRLLPWALVLLLAGALFPSLPAFHATARDGRAPGAPPGRPSSSPAPSRGGHSGGDARAPGSGAREGAAWIRLEIRQFAGDFEKWVESLTITSPVELTFRWVPHNIGADASQWQLSDKSGAVLATGIVKNPASGKLRMFEIPLQSLIPESPSKTVREYRVRIFPVAPKGGGEIGEEPGSSNMVTIRYVEPGGAGMTIDVPEEDIYSEGAHRWRYDFNADKVDDLITFARGELYHIVKSGEGAKVYSGMEREKGRDEGDVHVATSYRKGFSGSKWHEWFCIGNQIPAVGDFDGDGRADIVTFVRSSQTRDEGEGEGDVNVALSEEGGFTHATRWLSGFCTGDQIPAVGDFDGDGLCDLVNFIRTSESPDLYGSVFVALSRKHMNTFGKPEKWHQWLCANRQIPLVGDFNGDGRDDVATLVRDTQQGPGKGAVYVALSLQNEHKFGNAMKWHDSFCLGGDDIPAVGDFNGDGRDDIVSFIRCDAGVLVSRVRIALSTGKSFKTTGEWNGNSCEANEIPVVGDFDGDGRADIAVLSHDRKGGELRGDVNVALNEGFQNYVTFGKKAKWHENFCVGEEIPTTCAALFPHIVFSVGFENGGDRFACYASRDDDWFKDYISAFKAEFGDYWQCAQYYWGKAGFLHKAHLPFVDSARLAVVAGHGNVSFISMDSGEYCDLHNCRWGSWSSHSRTGDCDFIAFESCEVLSREGDWRQRWMSSPSKKGPFSGLHAACGFANKHAGSPVYSLCDEFAENLEEGYSVRWAWLEASNNENDNVWGHDNIGCVMYLTPHRNETIDDRQKDRWYHDPDYTLDADYWVYQ